MNSQEENKDSSFDHNLATDVHKQMIQVGTAVKKITPPIGIDLTGYAGRLGPACSVNDDLYAKAVVFDDGRQKVAVLSLDLLGLDKTQVEQIREAAEKGSGIPSSAIMIACTHTHAAPAVMMLRSCGDPDSEYIEWMKKTAAQAIIEASSQLAPADMRWAIAKSNLGQYRRGYVRRISDDSAPPEETIVRAILIERKERPARLIIP